MDQYHPDDAKNHDEAATKMSFDYPYFSPSPTSFSLSQW